MTAKLIGITGGFGSGKSAVAGFLRESGEEVLDADRIAHEALEKDSPAHPALARLFSDALDVKTGAFDKEKIAAVVFSDAEKRRRAEAVLHPYVFQRIAAALRRADRAMMFAEVPLLYESGFNVFCHKVIVVKAAPEVILERLCRKGFSAAEVGSRNAAQKSLQEKAERADFVIDNSGGLEETQRQTQSVLNSLRAELKGAK